MKKNFFTTPACLDEYIENVKNIVLDFGRHIVCEALEECNTLLEESFKRILYWQIKDHGQKSILSPIGTLSFTHTRFKNKETKETVMRQVRAKDIPAGNEEIPAKKKTVKYLYVEADEDHTVLQFNEKKEISSGLKVMETTSRL